MVKKRLVVAAALLISYGVSANAAEKREHKVRNAHKIIAILDNIGINSKQLNAFIKEADSHIEKDGFLSLTEGKVMGGKLALRCDTRGFPNARKFELRFTPENSPHVNFVANTNLIEVRYHLEF
jgi:hypothetical protein